MRRTVDPSLHQHVLGKFRRRLAGELPEDERARLESLVLTYERLYPEPKREGHAQG